MSEVTIYTDGCCLGNPSGCGGFGVVIIDGENVEEFSQGYISTTNNRMELMGILSALENAPSNKALHIISDSQYAIGVASGEKNASKNLDLVNELRSVIQKRQNVRFTWVKGHAGNYYNERCDVLASEATNGFLILDCGYEETKKGRN